MTIMFGKLSLGTLYRTASEVNFACGACGKESPIQDEQLPAMLSETEAAQIHSCPHCGTASNLSRLIHSAARTAQ